MVAGVIPVRAVGPARRDAQNRYSSDLGGSSSVDGCLLLTREMRQVYVDAGDIRCRCPAFAAGAGCRHRRALAEPWPSPGRDDAQRAGRTGPTPCPCPHLRRGCRLPDQGLTGPAGGHLHLPLQRRPACGTLASGIPLTPREVAVGAGGNPGAHRVGVRPAGSRRRGSLNGLPWWCFRSSSARWASSAVVMSRLALVTPGTRSVSSANRAASRIRWCRESGRLMPILTQVPVWSGPRPRDPRQA
jgi:hypothetical protein